MQKQTNNVVKPNILVMFHQNVERHKNNINHNLKLSPCHSHIYSEMKRQQKNVLTKPKKATKCITD